MRDATLAHPFSIVALISARGGGDWPPVAALAAGLHSRGHAVCLVCDRSTEAAIRSSNVPSVCVPPDLEQPDIRTAIASSKDIGPETSNPLVEWAKSLCRPPRGCMFNSVGRWSGLAHCSVWVWQTEWRQSWAYPVFRQSGLLFWRRQRATVGGRFPRRQHPHLSVLVPTVDAKGRLGSARHRCGFRRSSSQPTAASPLCRSLALGATCRCSRIFAYARPTVGSSLVEHATTNRRSGHCASCRRSPQARSVRVL